MSKLAQFGVSDEVVAGLKTPTGYSYPPQVKGRIAQIDADFMAYQVSAESKAELDPDDPTPRKTLGDMFHNAREAVDHIRLMAGAERAVLHTTLDPDKGGRTKIAIQKEYQANRKDRTNKPIHLDTIRSYLGSGCGDTTGVFKGRLWTDQEADDGMAQALYADPKNNILCSADKDLLMVPGWKMDMSSYKVYEVTDHFGKIWIDDTKSTKKVKGYGTKFFWAQVLMGDTADNIQGLPECPGSIWQTFAGTKAHNDLVAQWVACDDPKRSADLSKQIDKHHAKTKQCGPMLAFQLLDSAKTDKECFDLVRQCFIKLNTEHGYEFKHWRTGKVYTPTQVLLSEMKLLWMRRNKDENDVLAWLKEKQK